MTNTLAWDQAVQILAARSQHSEADYDAAVARVCDELPVYHGEVGAECAQEDWVREGSWDGTERIDDIQTEWDEYNASDDDE